MADHVDQKSKIGWKIPAVASATCLVAIAVACFALDYPSTVYFSSCNDRRVSDRIFEILDDEGFLVEDSDWVGVGMAGGYSAYGTTPPMKSSVIQRIADDARQYGYPLEVTARGLFGDRTIVKIEAAEDFVFRGEPFESARH